MIQKYIDEINRVRKAKKISMTKMSIDLGIGHNTISDFLSGRRYTNAEYFVMIMEYLGMISKEDVELSFRHKAILAESIDHIEKAYKLIKEIEDDQRNKAKGD